MQRIFMKIVRDKLTIMLAERWVTDDMIGNGPGDMEEVFSGERLMKEFYRG